MPAYIVIVILSVHVAHQGHVPWSSSYHVFTSMLSHLLLHSLVMVYLVRHVDKAFDFKQ